MSDFMPATVVGYSEWPKNTPNYYALPAMGDAVGWTYRKDWFSRPEIRQEWKQKYRRELGPPPTPAPRKKNAPVFPGPGIDRKKGYRPHPLTPPRTGGTHHRGSQ